MPAEAVVLVHGLWLPGHELIYLQKRLQRGDYDCRIFHYASLRRRPRENAMRLAAFADAIEAPVLHFVGHSLGGLIIRHLFDYQPQRPGRIVTLGTPHRPSHTAQLLYRAALLPFLGMSIDQGLVGGAPAWTGSHPLGSIAGTRGIGMGRLVPGLPKPNDGTVAVAETECPHMLDHLRLPVTHTSMLFSREVADQATNFLARGSFQH